MTRMPIIIGLSAMTSKRLERSAGINPERTIGLHSEKVTCCRKAFERRDPSLTSTALVRPPKFLPGGLSLPTC